ncbi:hypothetical protein Tco_1438412 [Tanacetum coccineum]
MIDTLDLCCPISGRGGGTGKREQWRGLLGGKFSFGYNMVRRHKQVLKTENSGKRIAFLENEHSKSFVKWLREEVERELAIDKESVSETVSTSEEIDYDSLEPPKSLLKWYHYLSDKFKDNGRFWGSKLGCNESDVKPSWKDIKKAKACMLAKAQASEESSKAKVEACGSKA